MFFTDKEGNNRPSSQPLLPNSLEYDWTLIAVAILIIITIVFVVVVSITDIYDRI